MNRGASRTSSNLGGRARLLEQRRLRPRYLQHANSKTTRRSCPLPLAPIRRAPLRLRFRPRSAPRSNNRHSNSLAVTRPQLLQSHQLRSELSRRSTSPRIESSKKRASSSNLCRHRLLVCVRPSALSQPTTRNNSNNNSNNNNWPGLCRSRNCYRNRAPLPLPHGRLRRLRCPTLHLRRARPPLASLSLPQLLPRHSHHRWASLNLVVRPSLSLSLSLSYTSLQLAHPVCSFRARCNSGAIEDLCRHRPDAR